MLGVQRLAWVNRSGANIARVTDTFLQFDGKNSGIFSPNMRKPIGLTTILTLFNFTCEVHVFFTLHDPLAKLTFFDRAKLKQIKIN